MLVNNAQELVTRCYEHTSCLLDKEKLKLEFIEYVFSTYQQEIEYEYGCDFFYRHLGDLNLKHCRRDFDQVVEEWYDAMMSERKNEDYHEYLFEIVKQVVIKGNPRSREELIAQLTHVLTSQEGLMKRWREDQKKPLMKYFRYLDRLGIRTYEDIPCLIDSWLIEYPNAFHPFQQELLLKQNRRGRPNNWELSLLEKMVQGIKPQLTKLEKERLRKIYYYHRNNLSSDAMLGKFVNYISMKTRNTDNKLLLR